MHFPKELKYVLACTKTLVTKNGVHDILKQLDVTRSTENTCKIKLPVNKFYVHVILIMVEY